MRRRREALSSILLDFVSNMPVLEDLGDKKGTNSHLKKQRDNLTHSTKCVLPKEKSTMNRSERVGEAQRG